MFLSKHVRIRCKQRGIFFRDVIDTVREPWAKKPGPAGSWKLFRAVRNRWLCVVVRYARTRGKKRRRPPCVRTTYWLRTLTKN